MEFLFFLILPNGDRAAGILFMKNYLKSENISIYI